MLLIITIFACGIAFSALREVSRLLTASLAVVIAIGYRFFATNAEQAIATPRDTFWRWIRSDQRALNRATRYALGQADFFTQYPFASSRGVQIARWLQSLR